jgi:2,3-bisphosphoglycerate-dependent phosphoglycerate mutase
MSAEAAEPHTRLVVLRHGETDWNAGMRMQGQTDIALNARGRWQAERLAAALCDEDIAAVYSSDLQRARDTAQALASRLGVPVQTDVGLRERGFGIFEGCTFTEIEQRWPEGVLRWRRREPDFAPDGGETLLGFSARSIAAAAALAGRHRGAQVVLVAHGGVLDCLYRAATRIELQAPRSWQLGNAAINRLLHSNEGFSLVGWDDARHLAEEGADVEPLPGGGG